MCKSLQGDSKRTPVSQRSTNETDDCVRTLHFQLHTNPPIFPHRTCVNTQTDFTRKYALSLSHKADSREHSECVKCQNLNAEMCESLKKRPC